MMTADIRLRAVDVESSRGQLDPHLGHFLDKRKTHVATERPPFERIALILQGGAPGAYEADVYQALAEANLHPDWVAGIFDRRGI
jgi:hypothetical protein